MKKLPFTENKQIATVLVNLDADYVRVYVQGASDLILNACTHWLNSHKFAS